MNVFHDMPPLVDANGANPRPSIPPPPGATVMAGYPTQHNAQPGWNSTMPQPHPPFPVQSATQEQWAGWSRYRQQGNVAPEPPSMPSPYIPHVPFPGTWESAQHAPPRRNGFPAAHPQQPSNPQQQPAQWNAWQPSSFNNYVRPPVSSFPTYPSAGSHTPASALSMTRSLSSSYVPPDWPGEPPKSWRRDFKFKSRLSALFRSRSVSRLPDESTDSACLDLAVILGHDRIYPPVILDLRRSPYTLVFRALDRQVFATDLMLPTTDPPTTFMRLYHTRLPWYIDVVPSGNGSYVTLGDLFTAICETLALRIRREEYYTDQLDHEDRESLKQAWDERCRNQEERMDGVKRVDYLRGKYMFEGLTRGKHGMWQLRTGRDSG